MAISSGMKWQIQNGGDDTNNGGGFRGGSIKAAPAAPTVSTSLTGGTVAAASYFAVVTITDGNGESSKSAESLVMTTSGATASMTVNSPTNPNDTGATWNVYISTATGGPYWSQGTGLAFGANRVITTTPPTSGVQAPGTDYSQSNSAQVNIDNAAITATTPGANSNVLTFTLGYTPTAADVGNTFQPTAGTNINLGIYEVIAWTSTTWTVTGAANLTTAGGAGAAIVGRMGGAFASVGKAMGFRVGSNDCYAKYNATPYGMINSNNVAGGNVNLTTNGVSVIGYNTTRTRDNTDALRPTFQASADSMTLFTSNSNNSLFANLIFDSNTHTSVNGMTSSNGTVVRNCKFLGMTTGLSAGGSAVLDCYASACATAFGCTGAGVMRGCVSTGHTVRGFDVNGNGAVCERCIADVTTATSAIGFDFRGVGIIDQCVVYGHTGGSAIGLRWLAGGTGVVLDTVSYGNTINFQANTGPPSAIHLFDCANGGAVTTELSGLFSNQLHGQITLSADPFTNAAGGDYSLNSAAGGGALLKAAGWPSSFAGISTNTAPDVGAAQGSVVAAFAAGAGGRGSHSIGHGLQGGYIR